MASVEERFRAAVNVIKGLPKNGPYQPSTAMMLKFYGLYKQATEGAPQHKKPAFWDVVGKAKWDAWNDNRALSKEQAMQRYVEGLREIIETMSYTENVQNFVGSLDGLDNINLDELEMIAPGMREMAQSHPSSPFNSRTNSPQHGVSANVAGAENINAPLLNGHASDAALLNGNDTGSVSDESDGPTAVEFEPEPISLPPPAHIYANIHTTAPQSATLSNGSMVDQSDDEYGDPIDLQHDLTEAMIHNSELLKQIQATVLRMNADLVAVNQRIGSLEKSVQEVRQAVQRTKPNGGNGKAHAAAGRLRPKWWPFEGISPAWFVLLVLFYPFVLKRMMATSRRR